MRGETVAGEALIRRAAVGEVVERDAAPNAALRRGERLRMAVIREVARGEHDESTERGHVATTTTTKSLSPTMERRRARRSSFCLADAPAIRRRESIDPTVHAHVS